MTPAAMKLSITVLITSFTLRRSFSSAAMPAHKAPMAPASSKPMLNPSQPGKATTCVPSAASPSAPINNWPSAPMFQTPAWNATATANPASNKGVVLTPTSDHASALPKAPSINAPNSTTGLLPDSAMMTATTMNAPPSASREGINREARRQSTRTQYTTTVGKGQQREELGMGRFALRRHGRRPTRLNTRGSKPRVTEPKPAPSTARRGFVSVAGGFEPPANARLLGEIYRHPK